MCTSTVILSNTLKSKKDVCLYSFSLRAEYLKARIIYVHNTGMEGGFSLATFKTEDGGHVGGGGGGGAELPHFHMREVIP